MAVSNRLSISNFKYSKVFILFNNLCEILQFENDFFRIFISRLLNEILVEKQKNFQNEIRNENYYLKTCRIEPGPPYSADHPCGVQKEEFHAQLNSKIKLKTNFKLSCDFPICKKTK
jgi:hypothetical protein